MSPKRPKNTGSVYPDQPQYKYEAPEFKPSTLADSEIEVKVRLANPSSRDLEFTMIGDKFTSFEVIRQAIIKRHGGSIVEVFMCINYFHKDECVDVTRQLKDYGITSGPCTIYYDFTPFSSPLLAA
ncbi:conserved hypothetical protein [Neospora caninum Liverpool]|uniref:Ubiquitin-like protein ATG12 n=1 Tax=Neospora caninum (strain Liverpool) TaxID=572307 RepID=F0V9J3_NEOCL|nr:conserved hypothetical protein [Neospora caninum Liverpool]CBZ50418.1 conserved hypothetical protein [Neospora caninum Liverpool]CEL65026.1 TPA: hypothetical protein BN1204_008870 [Neospora caninum Liverpool]|eukprot:XP_003880452.1 conserved hypothetical protein [Neospora caninum Liverpool]